MQILPYFLNVWVDLPHFVRLEYVSSLFILSTLIRTDSIIANVSLSISSKKKIVRNCSYYLTTYLYGTQPGLYHPYD